MDWENVSLVIFSSLFSGIIGIIISNYHHRKQQIKNEKIKLLTDILGYRYQLTENYKETQKEIIKCLNQIFIIFNDSLPVIEALITYKSSYKTDDLLTLIKRMCDNVGLNYKNNNDSLLMQPFSSARMH